MKNKWNEIELRWLKSLRRFKSTVHSSRKSPSQRCPPIVPEWLAVTAKDSYDKASLRFKAVRPHQRCLNVFFMRQIAAEKSAKEWSESKTSRWCKNAVSSRIWSAVTTAPLSSTRISSSHKALFISELMSSKSKKMSVCSSYASKTSSTSSKIASSPRSISDRKKLPRLKTWTTSARVQSLRDFTTMPLSVLRNKSVLKLTAWGQLH